MVRLAAVLAFGLAATACQSAQHHAENIRPNPSSGCFRSPPPTHASAASSTTSTMVPPPAERADLPSAYRILRRASLEVELTERAYLSALGPVSASLSPSGGSSVARGSAVRITPCPGGLG